MDPDIGIRDSYTAHESEADYPFQPGYWEYLAEGLREDWQVLRESLDDRPAARHILKYMVQRYVPGKGGPDFPQPRAVHYSNGNGSH